MKIVQTDKGHAIKAMVSEDNLVVLTIPCPASCGQCCKEDWKEATAFKILLKELTRVWRCPFLGKQGCELPSSERPIECTAHLCELGMLAASNLVTDDEVKLTLENHRQKDAFVFLGREP